MPTSDTFSKKLKKLRESRNLSISEVATLIGVPLSTYREWEYGRAIRGEPYVKIAKVYNITLDELFSVNKPTQDSYGKDLDKILEELSKITLKIGILKNKIK